MSSKTDKLHDGAPLCPVCSKPIDEGSVVVYRHGELIHMECWESRAHGPRR